MFEEGQRKATQVPRCWGVRRVLRLGSIVYMTTLAYPLGARGLRLCLWADNGTYVIGHGGPPGQVAWRF